MYVPYPLTTVCIVVGMQSAWMVRQSFQGWQSSVCAACKVEHHCVTYRHAVKQNIRQKGHYDVALTMHAGFFAV